jgi:drug/metabolite transporter (DMT)-like permease
MVVVLGSDGLGLSWGEMAYSTIPLGLLSAPCPFIHVLLGLTPNSMTASSIQRPLSGAAVTAPAVSVSGASRLGINPPTLIGFSAVLIWSATIGFYRSVAESFGSVGGAALIFTVAGLAGALRAGPGLWRGHRPLYLLLGGLLFIGHEMCLALALGIADDRAQSIELGLINYLWPCLIIVAAVLLRQQRASFLMIPGVALCLGGVMWSLSGGQGISPAILLDHVGANPAAYGLALIAALSWPAYTLLTRRMAGGRNAVPLFLLAAAAILWLKFLLGDDQPLVWDGRGVLSVLSFGVATTLAYSAWNHGIIHGNLALLASASYFTPVLSVLLSSLLFGSLLDGSFWLGGAIVTAGSLLCWQATRTPALVNHPASRPAGL